LIPLDKCIAKSNDAIWRMLDGEAVIISEDGAQIHTLNKIGSFIWELVDGKTTIDHIVTKICERFEIERDVAQADTLEFIEKLVDKQLIKLDSRC
jgi:hypothetical protein